MKRTHALLVFVILLSSAVAAGVDSLWQTGNRVQADVNRALALTLRQCDPDRIDADTIRVYRSHIQEVAIRDTAYLTVTISDEKNHRKAHLQASSGLTLGRLWSLSDQRASGTLLMTAVLWLLLSMTMGYAGSRAGTNAPQDAAAVGEESLNQGRSISESALNSPVGTKRPQGGVTPLLGNQPVIAEPRWGDRTKGTLARLCYDEASHRFTVNGLPVHFTPMQLTLMELFMAAPNHILAHQEICDRLWPKKPDASATLHTLIRRLKPVLQESAGLTIDCQRGISYQLSEIA